MGIEKARGERDFFHDKKTVEEAGEELKAEAAATSKKAEEAERDFFGGTTVEEVPALEKDRTTPATKEEIEDFGKQLEEDAKGKEDGVLGEGKEAA